MEYRSTDAGQHLSKGMVVGVEFGSGVEIVPASSSADAAIKPAGDETNKSVNIAGKGTGGVKIGGGSAVTGLVATTVQFTPPQLAANSAVASTYTVSGLTTNAAIIALTPRLAYSTQYAVHDARCSSADELTVVWSNTAASTIGNGESTGRWTLTYLKF
ncbi:MAG TPA: hypothetical protein VEA16_15170 [Vicinamibacterales bacterium]|nr:hypothetical protein [Vicinamibacterales bacterium]